MESHTASRKILLVASLLPLAVYPLVILGNILGVVSHWHFLLPQYWYFWGSEIREIIQYILFSAGLSVFVLVFLYAKNKDRSVRFIPWLLLAAFANFLAFIFSEIPLWLLFGD